MFKPIAVVLLSVCVTTSLANPMRPDPVSNVSAPSQTTSTPAKPKVVIPRLPTLLGVVIVGDAVKAQFNGQREVRIGETINGYRLTEVTADYVILVRGNLTRKLELKTSGSFAIEPATEDN